MRKLAERLPFHYAWVIVFCGCMIQGANLGIAVYTTGNFFMPISADFGCGMSAVMLYSTLSSVAMALFLPIARKIMQSRSIRPVILWAGVYICLTTALTSLCQSLWQLYAMSVLCGLGMAFISGITVPYLISNWFEKKAGTANGICLAAAGLMGVAANPLLARVIEASGWRQGFLARAAMLGVVLIPMALVLLRTRPADLGLLPYGAQAREAAGIAAPQASADGVRAATAFRSAAFAALLVMAPALAITFSFTNQLPAYMQASGMGASFGAWLTSISLVGATLGKLVFGMMNDRLGCKAPIAVSQGCVLVGLATIYLAYGYAPAMLAGAMIFGFGASCTYLFCALVTQATFGKRDYDKILVYVTMSCSLVGSLGAPIYGFSYDVSQSYTPALLICAACAVLTVACGFAALAQGQKLPRE